MLTQERLKELLHYDPETGVFTWLVDRPSVIKAGMRAGVRRSNGYEQICIDQRIYLAHRLAWLYMTGAWPKVDIDHENLERSDNRFCNLRDATRSQNRANKRTQKNNTSGYKGVSWDKKNRKWLACIRISRKTINLGRFACPTAAHFAYCRWAKVHFGEFARAA